MPETNTTPFTLIIPLGEQTKDGICQQVVTTAWMPRSCYSYGNPDFLLCTGSFDGAGQTMAPNTCRSGLLYIAHYRKLTGKPGDRGIFGAMVCNLSWLCVAKDAYKAVSDCPVCVTNHACLKSKRHTYLWPASASWFLPPRIKWADCR